MKCIARLKRRLLLETMWLAGGAGLRPGSGAPEGTTPSRLPAGIGATRAGFAWSSTFEHPEPRRGDRLARAGSEGKMISASACSRDERAEILGCPTPSCRCEVCSVSLPLAWNMPNPASEIVRPSSTTSNHFSKVNF